MAATADRRASGKGEPGNGNNATAGAGNPSAMRPPQAPHPSTSRKSGSEYRNTLSRVEHVPSEEEDNKLFVATGFRFLPAYERGFPYPWCAKRSKKGWLVRPSPPTSRREDGVGVEIAGWRAAEKIFQTRNGLMQRVKDQAGPPGSWAVAQGGRKNDSKPLKKRSFLPPNNEVPPTISITPRGNGLSKKDVDQWFRHTPHAIKAQQKQAREEEFQRFLKLKKQQYAAEVKQMLKRKRMEARQKKKELQRKGKEGPTPVNINQTPASPPVSPIRKKHKKNVPKRIDQNANSSIILGEDPQLDEMIENIVLEFTNEFSGAGQGSKAGGDSDGGIHFDGSAVSALREAARESLTAMTKHDGDNMGVQNLDTQVAGTQNADGGKISAPKNKKDSSEAATETYKSTTTTKNESNGERMMEENNEAVSDTDNRITSMIEQLIGEAEQGSGCHFDVQALAALREAAKEIVTSDD